MKGLPMKRTEKPFLLKDTMSLLAVCLIFITNLSTKK
jgi:hypothetical protein